MTNNQTKKYDLSIIVPFYNEEENLEELYNNIHEVVTKLNYSYEIILVDDGSTDKSLAIVKKIAKNDPHLKLITFTRNFGQTAAMSAGFSSARGKIYITIDADNQNDPKDIPELLKVMMDGNYGVVSGWRKNRKDTFLTRKLPSMIANWLISKVTGVKLKDYGCTLKAYKAEYIDTFNLYGEMHRFIPAYAKLAGAEFTEIPVNHFPRTKGKSKYGLSRTFKVFLDLITVKFLGSFVAKPIYLFGGFGVLLNIIAFLAGIYVIYQKFVNHVFVHKNPLMIISVFFSVIGIFLIMIGLLAEVVMRTYHESQGKTTYLIKEKINL